jgi:hypothetical protein
MSSMIYLVSKRGVRSLNQHYFRAPWPFVKMGARGQRKVGPIWFERYEFPGQQNEFPELSPKNYIENPPQRNPQPVRNPPELHDYTGCQPTGYVDPVTKKFVHVAEMVPELIVPDFRTNFKLLPYVSYRTDAEKAKR